MEEKKEIADQLAMWPKEIYTDEEYIEKFATFCTQHEPTQRTIVKILLKPTVSKHYGIEINFMELLDFDYKAASCLLSYPESIFPLFDKAILEAEYKVKDQHHRQEEMQIKEFVHARLARITKCEEHTKFVMPKASEIGKFIEISGTVIRTGSIKSIEWFRKYECITCKNQFTVEANIEQKNAFQKMYICPSGTCKSKGFRFVEGSAINRDYQEIKMQETIGSVGVGSIPRSLLMVLVDDLTDSCKAGDDIIVTGVVKRRWRWVNDGERCDIEILLFANALRVSNEQRLGCNLTEETVSDFRRFWDKYRDRPLYGRNLILRSICPNLYGLFAVKLALAVTLIGGVPCQTKNGLRVRGESHLLLVGEPGTGKSQFLKFATMLSMRSVLTTGIGSTSAGLTVTAVKETGGEWALEAGALVLADCGVCCIDEFSSIKERDRATIHEAMEQQTLSIAKAGLVCKLQTRTTVIAATNPKGKYDTDQNLSVNTTLASPLLSRFDLILVLLDSRDLEWDRRVSTHILEDQLNSNYHSADLWTLQILRTYVAYVKTISPELTPGAKEILIAYYKRQRRADVGASARTTIRLLESLIRISQAHARLMFRTKVIVQDAIMAVILMESSNHTSALTGGTSPLHSEFPDDPDKEYFKMEKHILEHLGLDSSYYVGLSNSQLTAKAVYPSQRQIMSTQSRMHSDSVDSDDDDFDGQYKANEDFSQTSIKSFVDDDDLDEDSRVLLERAKAAYLKITASTENVPKIESPLKKYVRLRNSQKKNGNESEDDEDVPSGGSIIRSSQDVEMKQSTPMSSQIIKSSPSPVTTKAATQTPKKTLMTTKKPLASPLPGPLDVNIPPASPSPQKPKPKSQTVTVPSVIQNNKPKAPVFQKEEEDEDMLELDDEDEPLAVMKQRISSQKSVSVSSQVSAHDDDLVLEDEEPNFQKPSVAPPSQDTSFDLLLEDEDEDIPLSAFKKPKLGSQLTPTITEPRVLPSPGLSPISDRSSSMFGEEDIDALELEDEAPHFLTKEVKELKTATPTVPQVLEQPKQSTTDKKKRRVFLNDDS